jgi:flagellin
LLDGSYKDQYLQVGSGNDSNDRIGISIGDARTARLGAAVTASVSGTRIESGVQIVEGGVTVNGYNVPATTSDGVSFFQSEGSAIAKANALNAISTKTGVTAAATASTYDFQVTEPAVGGDFKFLLNGVLIQGKSQFDSSADDATNHELQRTANEIVAKINAQTSMTGVYAKASTQTAGQYSLTADDGRNIVLSTNPADIAELTGDDINLTDDAWGATGINLTGEIGDPVISNVYSLTETSPATTAETADGITYTKVLQGTSLATRVVWVFDEDTDEHVLKANQTENVPENWETRPATADDLAADYAQVVTALGLKWEKTVPGSTTPGSGLDMFSMGNNDSLDSVVIFGGLELSSDSLKGITISGEDALEDNLGISIEKMVVGADASAGAGVGSVNLSTSSGAQSALTTLDRAINAVTDMRASMGAYQNRLTAAIANLENTSMNLTASRSRILDTDYAKETTNLAKSQIIQQAATAMLAQANQSSQSVLALLK